MFSSAQLARLLPAHAADADPRDVEFLARRRIAGTAQHVPGHDGDGRGGHGGPTQEASSAGHGAALRLGDSRRSSWRPPGIGSWRQLPQLPSSSRTARRSTRDRPRAPSAMGCDTTIQKHTEKAGMALGPHRVQWRDTRVPRTMRQTTATTTAVCLLGAIFAARPGPAADWPQWCGTDGKNMVSAEKGLPESFVPGEKRSKEAAIDRATAKNVKWGVKICDAIYSTPFDRRGKSLRRRPSKAATASSPVWTRPAARFSGSGRLRPGRSRRTIDGFSIGISEIPQQIGVCSSAAVDGDRVYFVSNRFEVVCLDVRGQPPAPRPARPASCGVTTCGTSWASFPATRPTARR